jgi:(R,R)-butanediol dehydrogenase / meso-butanediol dehydrogenase / diacetyl reductase
MCLIGKKGEWRVTQRGAYYCGPGKIEVGESEVRAPAADQVRIEVEWCGVCGTDLHIYQGHMDGRFDGRRIIGHEMSGRIVEMGSDVEGWKAGDAVVVRPLDPCLQCPACKAGNSHICQKLNFVGIDSPGAFQTSWTVPAALLHRLPEGLAMDLAALVEPMAVACHDVRLGEVTQGEKVVVIGGGPIGLLNALVAREAGAEVLVAEVNEARLKMAQALGLATHNPLQDSLEDRVAEWTGGAGADVVFEVSGSAPGAEMMTKIAKVRGRIVVVAIFAQAPKVDLFQFFWRELKLCGVRVYEPEDYEKAIKLVAGGQLPLEQLITSRRSLGELPAVFAELAAGAEQVKVMIDIKGA